MTTITSPVLLVHHPVFYIHNLGPAIYFIHLASTIIPMSSPSQTGIRAKLIKLAIGLTVSAADVAPYIPNPIGPLAVLHTSTGGISRSRGSQSIIPRPSLNALKLLKKKTTRDETKKKRKEKRMRKKTTRRMKEVEERVEDIDHEKESAYFSPAPPVCNSLER
ncbi:hypothetical protein FRB91_002264 [Serendipita sp. 411]|nr:hypothetical protein FRB91_002264 [Serendipita sp. 411]KAG9054019.1 hypothetical protein FS842_006427 [Serendipita sp. 407]